MSGYSFSALDRAFACPSSCLLPGDNPSTEASEAGTARHTFSQTLAETGGDVEKALASVPPQHRAACAAIDTDRIPAHLAAEVAMAYDVSSGKARELGRGMNRNYGDLGPFERAGTADLLGVNDDSILVWDLKGYAPPHASEWMQGKALALAACRIFGKERAVLVVCPMVGKETTHEMDLFDLESFAAELRDLEVKIGRLRAQQAGGQSLPVIEGKHCRFCHAATPPVSCPAKQRLVQISSSPTALEKIDQRLNRINHDNAGQIYREMRALEQLVKRYKESVRAFALHTGGFAVDPETVYGPVVEEGDREINGDKAYEIIRDLHGQAAADLAVTRETSQAQIKRALNAKVRKGEGAAKFREVMGELEEAGGITRVPKQKIAEYTVAEGKKGEAA